MELDPKFGIWAFSAIFALFFGVAKNWIYIDNSFNVYSNLKSTRKELSDATLMLEKEYHLGEIAIENHTLSQKNIPRPVKMAKIHQKVQNG